MLNYTISESYNSDVEPLPVVRSMKGSEGRATPMAFLIPYTLLTSHGATWQVSEAKFPVTFSAADQRKRKDNRT